MSVKSKEEIIAQITTKLGSDTSDETISLIEDITDTIEALDNSTNDDKDWKAEAERIDKEWREKYISRFTSGSEKDDSKPDVKDIETTKYDFENLFK